MKHKRKRMRQSVEARLVLNDWAPVAHSWLVHPVHGSVRPLASGTVEYDRHIQYGMADTTPLHERRGDAFWLAANYVIRKGWA